MRLKSKVMSEEQVRRTLIRIGHEITEKNRNEKDIVLVGLQKRGIHIARELASIIKAVDGKDVTVVELDIQSLKSAQKKTETVKTFKDKLPSDLTQVCIIITDDVLYTGRTMRKALDFISLIGIFKKVQLAALIDRGNREITLDANYIGKRLLASKDEFVSVSVAEVDGSCAVEVYALD